LRRKRAITPLRKEGKERKEENQPDEECRRGMDRTVRAAQVFHRRLKVLMLSQNVPRNGVEFLLGKSSSCIHMN